MPKAKKTPAPLGAGVLLMVFLDLGANVGRSRTLGARLSYETDLDTGIQAIEVGAAAAMEEVVVAVFGGDKPESALSNELLDGSRHCVDLLSRTYCLALSRPVRAGPTASAPRWVHSRFYPDHRRLKLFSFPPRLGEGRVGAAWGLKSRCDHEFPR